MQLFATLAPPRQFALARRDFLGRTSAVQVEIATGSQMKVRCSKQLRQPGPLVVRSIHLLRTVIVELRNELRPEMQRDLQSRREGDPHSIGASMGR